MNNAMFPLLTADQIEVKVKQATKNGALLLLYKTARTDYDMLDATVGALNWQAEYTEIKGNLYCTISIYDEAKGVWVRKSNCGIESRDDGEGNEAKGEASDAMKRAGVTWGIGRELYTSPLIIANVETEPDMGNKFRLKDRYERFDVAAIAYDEQRRIKALRITGKGGRVVYTYGSTTGGSKPASTPASAPHDDTPPPPEPPPEDDVRPPWEPQSGAGTAQANTEPKTKSGMATPFQLTEIKRLCTPQEYAALEVKHGAGLPNLTFAVALKYIGEIKLRKASQDNLHNEAKMEMIDARRDY